MDVAVYAPWLGALLADRDDAGGAEMQVLILVRLLTAYGYRAGVLVVPPEGVELPREIDGVSILPLKPWRPRRFLVRGLAYIWWILTLQRRIGAVAAHTYVQRGTGADTGIVALAAKMRRRRFVHATASMMDFDHRRFESRWAYRSLRSLGVRLADAVVVQTHEQAILCRAHFGRDPTVITSFAEDAPEAHRHRDVLLWIGRLAPYKRPERFLELARELPEARFMLVGGPDLADGGAAADAVKREAASLPNLTMLGPCPRKQVMELMRSAVAVVNTSDVEGMPNVFLEAWARGVPALALAHDPDGVIVREGLGAFADGSYERFVELARELWEARAKSDGLSRRCRGYVARSHGAEFVFRRWERVLRLPRR